MPPLLPTSHPHPFTSGSVLTSNPAFIALFRDRDFVQRHTKELRNLTLSTIGTSASQRRKWWKDAKKVVQSYEKEREERCRGIKELDAEAQEVTTTVSELQEAVDDAMSQQTALIAEHIAIDLQSEAEARSALETIVAEIGHAKAIVILTEIASGNLSTKSQTAAALLPQQLADSFQVYLNATPADLSDAAALSRIVKSAGEELQNRRAAAASLRSNSQSQLLIQVSDSPHKSASKTPLTARVPLSSDISGTVYEDTDELDEDGNSNLKTADDFRSLTALYTDAQILLREETVRVEAGLKTITHLKMALIKNQMFGTQSDDEILAAYAFGVGLTQPRPVLQTNPHLGSTGLPSLADDFPALTNKPAGPLSRYLENFVLRCGV